MTSWLPPSRVRRHLRDGNKWIRRYAGVCFVDADSNRVMLGKKRVGFGKGLWQHSMAGKAEGGETPMQTAVREAEEEVGIRPEEDSLIPAAVTLYEFTDRKVASFVMEVHIFVYKVDRHKATPKQSIEIGETEWFPADRLPLEQMWADNASWLPDMLVGVRRPEPRPKILYYLYNSLTTIAERKEINDI